MPNGITAPAEVIAWNLRAYGEADLADAIAEASELTLFRVWAAAFDAMATTSGGAVDYHLACGAIRALTGEDRPPRRRRRRSWDPPPKAEISTETFARWWAWPGD